MIADRWVALLCGIAGTVLLLGGITVLALTGNTGNHASFSLIAGSALLAAYLILDRGSMRRALSTRAGRRSVYNVLLSGLVVALAVGANVLAASSTASADLSRVGLNTLSDPSRRALQGLRSDAQATLWDVPTDPAYPQTVALLQRYRAASGRFQISIADPRLQRPRAASEGVVADGSVVLRYQGRTEVLNPSSATEGGITSALLKLTSGRTPRVCWVVGDGERDLKSEDTIRGYSVAGQQINHSNLAVKELFLAQAGAVPADCDLVAVVGPTHRLTPESAQALGDYLAHGGKLFVALDAWTDASVVTAYNAVLRPYGATFTGGLVVPDRLHAVRDEPTATAVFEYGASPITRGLVGRATVFPESTSITTAPVAGVSPAVVAASSGDSYLVQQARPDYDKRKQGDQAGPHSLAVALERQSSAGGGRVLLVGTSAFAENLVLNGTGGDNATLLAASLDWLAGQDPLIVLPVRPGEPPLTLTQDQWAVNVAVTLVLLPLLLAGTGLLVWVRRRLT